MSTIWTVGERAFSAEGSAVMHRNWRRTFGEEHEIIRTIHVGDEEVQIFAVHFDDPQYVALVDEAVYEIAADEPDASSMAPIWGAMGVVELRKAASAAGLKGAYKGYTKAQLIEWLTRQG
jgi:hypothetical protein